jgi:chloramphenicol-sensitive protein RarD
MTEAGRGVAAMTGACAIWGFIAVYYAALAHVPPLEILAHRVLWSVVFFGLVLGVQGRIGATAAMLAGSGAWRLVALAAVTVGANWFLFIFAVQSGQVLQSSLGYYIFPLVAVGLGFVVLGERFTRLQGAAIALAVVAVAVLAVGLGAAPWISLALAGTFGLYGLAKNRLAVGPVASVFAETVLLVPLALLWLGALHGGLAADPSGRPGAVFGGDTGTTLLLMLSGPLTGLPLVLFSYAARRVAYATLGLIQYLNPTIQFGVAVLLFGEAFTPWHALAFPLIWAALALYSWEAWRRERHTVAAGAP